MCYLICFNVFWFQFGTCQHVPPESHVLNRAIPCFSWTHAMTNMLLNESHHQCLLKAIPLSKLTQSSQSLKWKFFHWWNCFHSILDDQSPDLNDLFFIFIAFFVFVTFWQRANVSFFRSTTFPISLKFFYYFTIMDSGIKMLAQKNF